jgi:hypothetical protein
MLRTGDFAPFGATPHGTFAFRRQSHAGRLTVVLNLTAEPHVVPDAGAGRVLIGTHADRDGSQVEAAVELRPNEALIIEQLG